MGNRPYLRTKLEELTSKVFPSWKKLYVLM